jgi:hypothetical protein
MAALRPSMEPARTERPDNVMTRLSKESAAIRVVLPFARTSIGRARPRCRREMRTWRVADRRKFEGHVAGME